jgi:imidazole glycerol phosphate synthase subunit HisF
MNACSARAKFTPAWIRDAAPSRNGWRHAVAEAVSVPVIASGGWAAWTVAMGDFEAKAKPDAGGFDLRHFGEFTVKQTKPA